MALLSPSAEPPTPARGARPPLVVRCAQWTGWTCLAQALAFLFIAPPEDDARFGMHLAYWTMGMLLQVGLGCNYAGARFGCTVLLGLNALMLARTPLTGEGPLVAQTGIGLVCTVACLISLWLPGLHRWRSGVLADRRALPANAQRKLARRGLWYGSSWVAAALGCLVCADRYDMSSGEVLATFVPAVAVGGTLLAVHLIRLIWLSGRR